MMTEPNRKTTLLFLCDQKACKHVTEKSCDICKHTTQLNHAVNGHVFLYDPVKFLNERCWVLWNDERVIYEEIEDEDDQLYSESGIPG